MFPLLNSLEQDEQPLNCPVDRDKLSRDKVREFRNAKTFVGRVGEFKLFTTHCLQKVTYEPNLF